MSVVDRNNIDFNAANLPDTLPMGADIPYQQFMDAVDFSSLQSFSQGLRDRLNISDVILEREALPIFVRNGYLVGIEGIKEDQRKMFAPMLDSAVASMQRNKHAADDWNSIFECDFSVKGNDGSMIRVHGYKHEGGDAMSMRIQSKSFLKYEQLGFHPEVLDLFNRRQGLIIFGGPVRSGKTNSMHAIIEHRNENGPREHNIVVADPPEFLHKQKYAKITTRELGINAASYKTAIKGALRIKHHLLVIGEMRGDRATARAILQACDLGSLCVTTAHTNNTAQTIRRFTNIFTGSDSNTMAETFQQAVIAIFFLVLVPTVDGREVMAHEVFVKTNANEGLLKDPRQIAGGIDVNNDTISHSLDKHLAYLCYERRLITEETMRAYAHDKVYLQSLVDRRDYHIEGLPEVGR